MVVFSTFLSVNTIILRHFFIKIDHCAEPKTLDFNRTPAFYLHGYGSKSFYLWWMRTSTSNTISSAQREFSITQIVVTADGHSQLPFRGRLLSNCISLHDLRGCRGWQRHCSNCRFGHQPRYNRRSDLYQAKREKIGRSDILHSYQRHVMLHFNP